MADETQYYECRKIKLLNPSDKPVPHVTYPSERYDPFTHAVPPNTKEDVLVLTSGAVQESGQMLLHRLRRADFVILYAAIIIMLIVFISSTLIGSSASWYKNLIRPAVNPWIIRILWFIAVVLSLVGVFLLWEHVSDDLVSRDLTVTALFLVGSFISLAWSAAFYHAENIRLAVWIALLLFVYKFWLFTYVWHIKPLAAIFLIPLVIMNLYTLYATIHIASINNIHI